MRPTLERLLERRSRLSQLKDRVRIELAVLNEYYDGEQWDPEIAPSAWTWLAHYSAHLNRRYDDVIAEIRYRFPDYLEVQRVEVTRFGDTERSYVEGLPGPPS